MATKIVSAPCPLTSFEPGTPEIAILRSRASTNTPGGESDSTRRSRSWSDYSIRQIVRRSLWLTGWNGSPDWTRIAVVLNTRRPGGVKRIRGAPSGCGNPGSNPGRGTRGLADSSAVPGKKTVEGEEQ